MFAVCPTPVTKPHLNFLTGMFQLTDHKYMEIDTFLRTFIDDGSFGSAC
jgi:hypothetical protein